uniref:Protein BUD31 homolog n=1 Tax=Parascaris equorum TaxID=6256 RepID=A0A914RG54_PAREQ
LYQFCLDTKLADAKLIAKWKKQGYENLCCLRCIQTRDTNFGTNCICRVPKSKLDVKWKESRFNIYLNVNCAFSGVFDRDTRMAVKTTPTYAGLNHLTSEGRFSMANMLSSAVKKRPLRVLNLAERLEGHVATHNLVKGFIWILRIFI